MVYFDNCEVFINGSGLVAESASLDMQNGMQALYAVGQLKPLAPTPNGFIQGTLSLSYIVEPANEPVFPIINRLKTDSNTFNWLPDTFVLAGVTGSGYLDAYSLRVSQSDYTRATASFAVFFPISGALTDSKSSRDVTYRELSHGWNTFLIGGNSFNLFDFSYSYRANWEPTYTIGATLPLQVQLISSEEAITVVGDTYAPVTFSGQPLSQTMNDMTGLHLTLHKLNPALSVSFSGLTVKSTQINASPDDIIKVSITATASY